MSKEPEVNGNEEHPEHPGLTRAEVAQAKERAKAKLIKEQKASALDRIADQEEINLREAMGQTERTMCELENLSPVNREMVEIELNLAPQMADIRIDGVIYRNRGKYTVTRAKAMDMLRMQFEGWRHEAQRKGDDSYAFYSQMHQQNRPPVVINTRLGITSGAAPKGTH